MKRSVTAVLTAIFLSTGPAWADEIHLHNGDRYTGTIVEADDETIRLETDAAGLITLKRSAIARVVPAEKPARIAEQARSNADKKPEWTGGVSLGYNQNSGNTNDASAAGSVHANRKTEADETTFKADASYAAQNKEMTTRKYYGMARYAYSFGETRKWYHFLKMEADHDRFADVDYRLVPSTGVGYWFSDTDEWKFMTELGAGVEHTEYRGDGGSRTELVAVPRLFAAKKIGPFRLSEDLTLYPALTDPGEYRLRSESVVEYPLDKNWSARLSLVDEYNSNPVPGARKNDIHVISSLAYNF